MTRLTVITIRVLLLALVLAGWEWLPRLGVVKDDGVHDVTAATDALPNLRWPLPPGDQLIANLATLRPRMEELANAAPAIPLDAVCLLSPVANPGKFVCGAGNWKHHGAPFIGSVV